MRKKQRVGESANQLKSGQVKSSQLRAGQLKSGQREFEDPKPVYRRKDPGTRPRGSLVYVQKLLYPVYFRSSLTAQPKFEEMILPGELKKWREKASLEGWPASQKQRWVQPLSH
jgi:hypothetical protein